MTVVLVIYLVLSIGVAVMAYMKSYDMIEYFFLSILATPFAYFLSKTDKLR